MPSILPDSKHLILASASPRRSQLLKEMDVPFSVSPVDVEEVWPDDLETDKIAVYLSRLKASAFPSELLKKDTIVMAADTIVLLDGKVLGKPMDRDDAIRMLQELSGRMHEVITGVTLRDTDRYHDFSDLTKVYFGELSQTEIETYVDTYKPFDKAGSYGVQEWIGHVVIDRIEGSYTNVMGLPTAKVYKALRELRIKNEELRMK
ncbi:MAG: septum formation protein Maf [Flavobacteriales bacterium]|nr:septum formation protein Maf [Flavobacteriales bacterium]